MCCSTGSVGGGYIYSRAGSRAASAAGASLSKEVQEARGDCAAAKQQVLRLQCKLAATREQAHALRVELDCREREAEVQSGLHAQQVGALTAQLGVLHADVAALETQRSEERARLETEVAALADALRAKRGQCERLQQANARVLAQFEAAEAEFLAAERRRPTTVVGKLVDAVFGAEPPPPADGARAAVELNQRGAPSDRLALVAAASPPRALGHARATRRARDGARRAASAGPRPRGGGSHGGGSRAATRPAARAAALKPARADEGDEGDARKSAAALIARARLRAEREAVAYGSGVSHSVHLLSPPSTPGSTATGGARY